VIDDTLAKLLFGSEDAIGRRIVLNAPVPNGQSSAQGIEVVGIVHSPHEDVIEEAAPRRVYRPLGQAGSANIYLHVKTTSPGIIPTVLDQLHRELPSFDSDAGVLSIKPISVFVDKNINQVPFRLAAIVFGGFGAMALFLAVVGVYGVKAYAVSRRIREVGIRLALGARPSDVLTLILKQGAMQTAIGVLGGIVLALLAGLALSRMLFQVSPADPFVLAVSASIIAVATLIACFVPARRAARTDATTALRSE
jgi:putative ABC transport system permease protein